jgi:predicted aspartyl protease
VSSTETLAGHSVSVPPVVPAVSTANVGPGNNSKTKVPGPVRKLIKLGASSDSTGVASQSLMQFPAKLSKKHAKHNVIDTHLLVDTGASDCFVNLQLCKDLGITVHGPEQTCALADDSSVKVFGHSYITVDFGNYQDEIKCLVMDLKELDLMLGEPWLLNRAALISYLPPSVLIKKGKNHVTVMGSSVATDGRLGRAVALGTPTIRMLKAPKFVKSLKRYNNKKCIYNIYIGPCGCLYTQCCGLA